VPDRGAGFRSPVFNTEVTPFTAGGVFMDFDFPPKVKELQSRVSAFMEAHVLPNEATFIAEVDENRRNGNAWIPTKIIETLKEKAKAEGLWNLWRPKAHGGTLTNLEYAPLCEIMGRVTWGPKCSTARRPTPATWKCCCATAARNTRRSGSSRCSPVNSVPRS
jgi:hypothetical protein